MKKNLTLIAKTIFSTNYSFVMRYMPLMALLGVFFHVFFFLFFKYGVGLQESLLLRFISSTLIISIPITLRNKLKPRYEKIIFETTLIFLLPFFFSYMSLVNNVNIYWATAAGFCGFFYGLLSKPFIMPFGYLAGILTSSYLYTLLYGYNPALLKSNMLLVPVAYFPALISTVLVTGLELSYNKVINMKTRQISLLETEKNYEKLLNAEKNLRENEEKYRLLVNNSSDAIFVLQDNIIQFVNNSATEISGYTKEELISKSFLDFVYPEDHERAINIYLSVLSSQGRSEKNQFQLMANKKNVWVETDSVYSLWNGAPALFNFASDITEKKFAYEELFKHRNNLEELVNERTIRLEAINKELTIAKNEAEAATLAKNEFLANMSHEIRTPLNAVTGISDLMEATELTNKQKEYIKIIKSSSTILLSLINDILDFSKIEAGQMDFEEIPFLLSEVIDNVADIFREKILKKELEFIIDIAENVPQQLISDPLRLKQVLTNLTSNALKFTDKGEITIAVSVIKKTSDYVTLLLSIQDTGIGIRKDKISSLFMAFSQADSSTTRKYGGTGLGLSITKQIAEMMNGTISVESIKGKGSKFNITADFKYLTGTTSLSSMLPAEMSGLRVLIVEDNPATIIVLKRYIESFGLRADTANSSRRALKQYSQSVKTNDPFNLIIMDIKLPEQNGIVTAEKIKQLDNNHSPSIIYISSSDYTKFKDSFRDPKHESFLSKPVKQSSLFDSIMDIFGYFPRAKKNYITESITDTTTLSGANVLLVEDNKINQLVATEILNSFKISVTPAINGYEAVRILKKENFDAVLMDIQMPVMDGLEASGIIRNELNNNKLPIIAMTANAMRGDKEKCIIAGMNDYISKPIESLKLFSILKRWISPEIVNKDKSKEQLPERPPARKNTFLIPQELPGIDVGSGLKRVNNNKSLYHNLLVYFYEENKNIVETIRSAVDTGQNKSVLEILHSIKGTAGNISANELVISIQNLETNIKNNEIHNENLFSQFENAMEVLIGGLKELATKSTSLKTKILPFDKNKISELQPMFNKLYNLLKNHSFSAEEYLNKISHRLDDSSLQQIESLSLQISNLDFPNAIKTLNDFAANLGIVIDQE